MFEKASKLKLRLKSNRGLVKVEDLWDIPAKGQNGDEFSLSHIKKNIRRRLRDFDEDEVDNSEYKILELSLGIVNHVIEKRLEESEAKTEAILNKQKVAKIDRLIEQKKDGKLEELSVDDLEKIRADLV